MKYTLLFAILAIVSCKNEPKENVTVDSGKELKVEAEKPKRQFEVYDYDGLEPLINKEDGKVHVVNFWATWCAPCVKELPHFETLNKKYKDQGVEVLLVSLDFPNKYDTKLTPFIEKNKLQSEVVAFDDVDQNRWIPAINEEWSGAIPATIIYDSENRKFYEKS